MMNLGCGCKVGSSAASEEIIILRSILVFQQRWCSQGVRVKSLLPFVIAFRFVCIALIFKEINSGLSLFIAETSR